MPETRPHAVEITETVVARYPLREGRVITFERPEDVPSFIRAHSTPLEPWRAIPMEAVRFDREEFDAMTKDRPAPPKPVYLDAAEVRQRLGWTEAEWTLARQTGFPEPTHFRASGEPLWTPRDCDIYRERLAALKVRR